MCVGSRALLVGSSTFASEAARQGKTAVVTAVPAILTVEFAKFRRRPRRDSHGTFRLSGVYSHLLGQ